MELTEEIFNRHLYPAELKRGIKLGWKPTYIVIVLGENWIEAHSWIKHNVAGLWMDHIYQPEYFVGFEKKGDAVAFKLRWL